MTPWIKLARRLACETLCHWRGFVHADEEAKREKVSDYARENGNVIDSGADPIIDSMRSAYQIPRDTRAFAAKHVKAIALATRKPTMKQLREDLGLGATWDFGLASWPKDHLARALEEYARRFVGTDYAPKFARNVMRTLKAS